MDSITSVSLLKEYAIKLNKSAVEAKVQALKSSIAKKKPSQRLTLEQQLYLLNEATEKAQKGTWSTSQAAFVEANSRMDNVNESLTYSSENIQEALHVMKNVTRHLKELSMSMEGEDCFYRKKKDGVEMEK
ncbi:hypothetical protein THRCLA_21936 [Thraustotheca clavata]|uniref:Uncharacterized protein n=1 Tax=Thraustotheca clavata TaxID=74557 RepID=A0A1V9ZHG7_9STRA|nr:hypothetical protein THRCLA_21936 [Thraustotheca clavata]